MTTKTKIMALSFSAIGMLTIANIYSGNSEHSYKQQNKVDQKQQANEPVIESPTNAFDETQVQDFSNSFKSLKQLEKSQPNPYFVKYFRLKKKALLSNQEKQYYNSFLLNTETANKSLKLLKKNETGRLNPVLERDRWLSESALILYMELQASQNNFDFLTPVKEYLTNNLFNKNQSPGLRRSLLLNQINIFKALYTVNQNSALEVANMTREIPIGSYFNKIIESNKEI